jgi:WD40 repeat protein
VTAKFSPNGALVVTASEKAARVWDANTGEELVALVGHTDRIAFAAWSPDGSRVATAGMDQTVRIWDSKTGAEFLTLKGHAKYLSSVSFSRDGSRLLSAGSDGTARVWDSTPVKRENMLREVASPPRSVRP